MARRTPTVPYGTELTNALVKARAPVRPKPKSGFKEWRNSPAGVAKDRRPIANRPKVTLPKFNLP